jgi:hypothetical protein
MLGKIIASCSVVSAIGLVVLLQTTTPATVGPLGILLVFILMYITALGMLTFLFIIINRLTLKLIEMLDSRKAHAPMSLTRAYYFASVMALAPVMVIGMQSVSQVGLYEFSLVVIFLVVASVYVAKRTRH